MREFLRRRRRVLSILAGWWVGCSLLAVGFGADGGGGLGEYEYDFGLEPLGRPLSRGTGMQQFGFAGSPEIPAGRMVSQVFTAPSPRLAEIEGMVKEKLSEKGTVQVLEPDSIVLTDENLTAQYLKGIVEHLGFKATKTVPAPEAAVTMVFTYSILKEAETTAKALVSGAGRVQTIQPNMLLISDTAENMDYVGRVLGALGFEAGEAISQADLVTRAYAARNVPLEDLLKLANQLKSPRGRVDPFPPSTLLVTDTVSSIEYMSKVFENVDNRPVLVMIEAQTYEIFTDITSDYGLDILWRAKSAEWPTPYIDLSLLGRPPIPEDTAFTSTTLPGRHGLGSYHIGTRIGALRGSAAGLDMGDIKVMLDFLVSEGYAELLTNPKIVVANGKKAVIATGERIPYRAYKVVGGTEAFVTEYETAEIKLEVTPYVNEGGYITMEIEPQADTLSGFRGPEQVPVITKRDAKTYVTISSGSTLVIGGLKKTETREVNRRVPGIWRLPLIGKLFESKDVEESDTNLFVSITPHILSYGEEAARFPVPRAALDHEEMLPGEIY